jgi:hypothetical protein
MKRKLIFLGAGFDVPAGIPTMLRFFPKVWNLMGYATGLGGHEHDIPAFCAIRHIWEAWYRRPETKNNTDLEEFSLFVEQHHPDSVPDLRYLIARTLDLSKDQKIGYQGASLWKTIYLPFARDLLQHRNDIAVLSVNYSLTLDQALLQVGAEPDYQLPGEIIRFNDDNKSRQPVDLFKPHGSINLLVPRETGRRNDVVVDLHPGPVGEERAGNWQTSEKTPHPHDNDCLLKPLIAPPRNEGKQSFDPWEDQLLSGVKGRLNEILPHIEACFFIGWSAPETDEQDVIPLLRDGLKQCQHCWVLNFSDGRDGLQYALKENYSAFIPKGVVPQWDWDGMREPSTIPLWGNFLKI